MKQLKLVKNLFKTTLFILLLLTEQACAMNEAEKYLELNINSEKIDYYIKINDVKVYNESGKSPVTQTVPINHWANNGVNNLLVAVDFGRQEDQLSVANNATLNVSLILRIKHGDTEEKHIIASYDLKPSEDLPEVIASSSLSNISFNSKSDYKKDETGDISIGSWNTEASKNWIDYTQEINLELNLPAWSYLSADDLGTIKDMSEAEYFSLRDEVHDQYKLIWELLDKKDSEGFLKLTALRSSEFDSAFHLSAGSKQDDMKRSLESAFSNEDLSLYKFIDSKFTRLSIHANGKIANLKAGKAAQDFILFRHNQGAFTRTYDFYFMKKDGKWIIIR